MSTRWPRTLASIAEELGEDVAARLARKFGGRELSIPTVPGDAHPLVETFGRETARRIGEILGPGRSVIPLGPESARDRLARTVASCLARGMSVDETARTAGCHVRTVYRIRSRMRRADSCHDY